MIMSPETRTLAVGIARVIAWILALLILLLSVVPARLRPETDIPHNLEHFAIFFVTGIAFACGYGQKVLEVAIALIAFSGVIEIVQFYVPGRHARLSDFLVDAAALCIGVAVASFAGARRLRRIN
jgi:VanZ family protein